MKFTVGWDSKAYITLSMDGTKAVNNLELDFETSPPPTYIFDRLNKIVFRFSFGTK